MTLISKNNTLGTLGPEFSFHDILRKEKVGHLPFQFFDSFEDIFEALQNNHIQTALIATKNSIHGKVAKNAEVISSLGLEVIKSYDLPISLHLAARQPLSLNQVKEIYAHPVAWNECQSFLSKQDIKHLVSSSNSQALIDLKSDSGPHIAAISGREAIQQSNLKLIHENIHDHEPNITSFSLIVKKINSQLV